MGYCLGRSGANRASPFLIVYFSAFSDAGPPNPEVLELGVFDVNWITNYVRPRINSMLGRRDVPDNLWIKCPETG